MTSPLFSAIKLLNRRIPLDWSATLFELVRSSRQWTYFIHSAVVNCIVGFLKGAIGSVWLLEGKFSWPYSWRVCRPRLIPLTITFVFLDSHMTFSVNCPGFPLVRRPVNCLLSHFRDIDLVVEARWN